MPSNSKDCYRAKKIVILLNIITSAYHTQEYMVIHKFNKILGRFRKAQGILSFFKLRVTQTVLKFYNNLRLFYLFKVSFFSFK